MPRKPVKTPKQLITENEDLRTRLDEAEETLRAIRSGEVDALVVSGVNGEQIFTLRGADRSYRMLIEDMNEGALTLSLDGVILYCNRRFAEMLKTPLENVIGSDIHTWIAPDSQRILQSLLRQGADSKRREQLALTASDGTLVTVSLSVSNLLINEMPASFCLVATDLTEQKRSETIAAAETLARELLATSSQSRLVLLSVIEDQKRAEEALRRNEAQLLQVGSLAKVGGWELDLQTMTPYWSLETYRIHEVDPSLQPDLENTMNFYAPEARPIITEAVRQAIEEGLSYDLELPFITATGRHIWVRTQGVPELRDGKCVRLFGAFQDVTERKQAEETLRQSEEQFRSLFEDSPISLWVEDFSGVKQRLDELREKGVQDIPAYLREYPDFVIESAKQIRILDVNNAAMKLYHAREKSELLGTLANVLHAMPLEQFEIELIQLANGRLNFEREEINHTLTGEKIHVNVRWSVAPGYEDSLAKVIVSTLDISERKRAEEKLLASEVRYRRLFEATRDGILILDADTGEIVDVNPFLIEMLGYSHTEFLGRQLWEIGFFKDIVANKAAFLKLQEERYVRYEDLPLETNDGRLIWVEFVSNAYGANGKQVIQFNIRDISERKQAEETLREKERLLSEAQRIAHMGSWSYDIAADTLLYSDEMYRLLDISQQEFQHNSEGFLGLIHSPDRPMVAKWMEGIRVGRQAGELEFLVFRKNGELRYIRCQGAVEFDRTGKPARFIGTAQDVTERKLAEIQIRQQVERLTALRKIDQAISSSFDLNVTLDILLSQVISQLQVDAADVLLRDPDGKTFTYAAGKGFRTQAIETARLHLADSQAVRERRSIHVENLENKPDNRLFTPLGATEDFVCYFGLPLIVKGKVKGVLEVFHRAPLHPYAEWLEFLDTLVGQAAIAIEDAVLFENLERSNRELSQAYDATIEGWSRALDLRDKETEGHTQRVTAMTMDLARAFRLPEEELLHIRRGGLLHDIGKMGVPDNILLKPGELTEEEWARMRSHPLYAYDLLKPITFLAPALHIPYCHHEKWDGTGYPRGLKGQEIPLVARLFAVVDVWDALLSDRPYRKAWPREEVLEHIKSLSGTHFDPKVVEIFLDLIKE